MTCIYIWIYGCVLVDAGASVDKRQEVTPTPTRMKHQPRICTQQNPASCIKITTQKNKNRTRLQDLAPVLGEGRQLVQGVAQHQLHPDLHLRVGGAIVLVLVLSWGLCIQSNRIKASKALQQRSTPPPPRQPHLHIYLERIPQRHLPDGDDILHLVQLRLPDALLLGDAVLARRAPPLPLARHLFEEVRRAARLEIVV